MQNKKPVSASVCTHTATVERYYLREGKLNIATLPVKTITDYHSPWLDQFLFLRYMVSCSSQIWVLSRLKCFFWLSTFSILATGWSLMCILSLFLLFLSGYCFDSLCSSLISLSRDGGGDGWTQPLYYIAELCLPYYSMDKRYPNKVSWLLSIIISSSKFRSRIATILLENTGLVLEF